MSLLILQSCMPGEYDDMEKTDVFIEENESYNSFDRSRNPSGDLDESSVQISPQMADRFYISNVLIDIFGEQVDQYGLINHRIVRNQAIFGGPCDKYERVYNENTRSDGSKFFTSQNVDSECRAGVEWTTKHHLNSTSLRQGWMIRTCEDIFAHQPQAIQYALGNLGILTNSVYTKDRSYEHVQSIYQAFHGVKSLHREVYETLLVHGKDLSDKDFWEGTLMTFCISPEWQAL